MILNVKSEIGKLKEVVVHRPGKELENLTPSMMSRLLFDDIPWLEMAQQEHDAFVEILRSNDIDVIYLRDLIVETLKENDDIRLKFINQYVVESGVNGNHERKQQLIDFLSSLSVDEMIDKAMGGVKFDELPNLRRKKLSDYLNEYPFVCDPMPNLYFTRDPFASIGESVAINKMKTTTRNRETIFGEYIFKYHEKFKDVPRVYSRKNQYSIEGGDILVLSEEVVAVGVSERTEPAGVEELAERLFADGENFKTVLVFNIPKARTFMHLDTVFTQVDYDKFTIHGGIINSLEVFELHRDSNEVVKSKGSLEEILSRHLGRDISLIMCGGESIIDAGREQWNDGANTLCIAPGEVVVYSRNQVTNRLLEESGVKLHIIPSSELSRGRGGPRCMSMPLRREKI